MADNDQKEIAMNDVVVISAVIFLLKVLNMLNIVIFTGTMSWCPNNNHTTSNLVASICGRGPLGSG